MYSLAMLLVTLTAIYAYRIYKAKDSKEKFSVKNWVLFAICSLTGAYTHYYALMTSGLINLLLMISLIIQCVKNREFTNNMKAFIVSGVIQIALYIPWVLILLFQFEKVSRGFWITVEFPGTLIELFTFQFTGNLLKTSYVSMPVAIIWGLAVTVYMAFLYLKDRKLSKDEKEKLKAENQPAKYALLLFLGIALAACIVSLVMMTVIIYARYMLCVMGLFMFFLAYTMGKKGEKYFNLLMCFISILLSLYINIDFININYDEINQKPIEYIKEDIQDEDIFIMGNEGSGFTLAVNFLDNSTYFYDKDYWNSEEAYKVFSHDFHSYHDLDFLENYTGRVWIINDKEHTILEEIQEKYDVNVIKQEVFEIKYKTYNFAISLIEK